MLTQIEKYPEIYLADNSSYHYRDDDDCLIELIAGVDGVTEEHIEALKQLHRDEMNNEYRQSGLYYKNGEPVCHVVHFDAYTSDQLEYMNCFVDIHADIESNYISDENVSEIKACLMQAWKALSASQKQLFVDVIIRKIPQRECARRRGVSSSAINQQVAQIKKICKSYVNCLNFGLPSHL